MGHEDPDRRTRPDRIRGPRTGPAAVRHGADRPRECGGFDPARQSEDLLPGRCPIDESVPSAGPDGPPRFGAFSKAGPPGAAIRSSTGSGRYRVGTSRAVIAPRRDGTRADVDRLTPGSAGLEQPHQRRHVVRRVEVDGRERGDPEVGTSTTRKVTAQPAHGSQATANRRRRRARPQCRAAGTGWRRAKSAGPGDRGRPGSRRRSRGGPLPRPRPPRCAA